MNATPKNKQNRLYVGQCIKLKHNLQKLQFLEKLSRGSSIVINQHKASGYTVYLLVNSILKVMVHLQML